MPSKCYVSTCDSGTVKATRRYREEEKPSPSLFKVTEVRLQTWKDKVPQRGDRGNLGLKVGHFICSRHFEEDEVIKSYTIILKDGTVYTAPKSPPELVEGAIPHIFDEPEYLSEPVNKRKAPAQRPPLPPKKPKKKTK